MNTLGKSIVFLLALAPLAFAQGTYTQIDVPGFFFTYCWGINQAGDIVGQYEDANEHLHGFLLSDGTYTTIDYGETVLYGVNDRNQIVGTSGEGLGAQGFLYDLQTNRFTKIVYPETYETQPRAINNAGAIVGYFVYHGHFHGFEFVDSTYGEISPPGSLISYAYGISGSGEIVGVGSNRQGYGDFNFTDVQAKYGVLNVPNASGASVMGINHSGTALVGFYKPTLLTSAGFVYQSGTVTTLEFPGSNETFATGINDLGEVVGYFFDANNDVHGFTWTPSAPAEKTLSSTK